MNPATSLPEPNLPTCQAFQTAWLYTGDILSSMRYEGHIIIYFLRFKAVNLRRGVLASTVPEKVHNLVNAEKWTVGATKWTLVEPFHDKGCCLIHAGS